MLAEAWLCVLAVAFCLIASFFLSGSQTALAASSRARLHQLARGGSRRAGAVNALLDRPERLAGALLLGSNIATIAASAIMTGLLLEAFGEIGVIYAIVAVVAVVLVFSVVLPKTIAIRAPEHFALAVVPIVRIIVAVLGPVTMAIQFAIKGLLALFGTGIDADAHVLSPREELRGAVDLLHQEGGVEKHDRDMLGGLLDLNDLSVSDVMIHRTKVVSLDADLAPPELVRQVLAAPYTRIPLWRGQPENIVGIVHAKDLLRAMQANGGDAEALDVADLAKPVWFVPDSTSLPDQLRAFLKKKAHFALVVDEYGEVMGIVTLEDIIEEIVGEISDEHDVLIQGMRPRPDGSVTVDGGTSIRDLNRAMDWHLPDEEATTIAGLVIHEARTIPAPKQAFTFHGFRFQVLRRERNRITTLKITPLKASTDQTASA